MLARRHVQFYKSCVRYGQGGRSTAPRKPYNTRKKHTPKYKYDFDPKFHYQTGVTLDKMISEEECHFLEYVGKHKHKTTPLAVTDRVHELYEILPGVSVGPKFFDHEAGDTRLPGNEESAKINNFLHLTPPMIQEHCKQLAKLTTPLPDLPETYIKQYSTNYLYHGPSIKHPASRSVSLKVNIKELGLGEEEEEYFRVMVSANKNLKLKDIKNYAHYRVPKLFRSLPVKLTLEGDVLTITSEQCPTRDQNLALSYYRLSGFISESKASCPVRKEFHIPKLFTDFVFDLKEENVTQFEENNFVKVIRTDGAVVALEGSPEAVSLAKNVLLDVSSDLIVEEFIIPEPFSHYIKEVSSTVKEMLQNNEAIFFADQDKIVTYSDTIENLKEELNGYISQLNLSEIACPENLTKFVLDPVFLSTCGQYDAYIAHHEGVLQLIVKSEDLHLLDSMLQSKIQEVRDTVETSHIACQHSVNWDKLSKQFGAHVTLEDEEIIVTADPETIREISYFIKQKDAFSKQSNV